MPLEQVDTQAKEMAKRQVRGFEAIEENSEVITHKELKCSLKDDPKCNEVLHGITFGLKCNKLLRVISFGP